MKKKPTQIKRNVNLVEYLKDVRDFYCTFVHRKQNHSIYEN